MGVSPRELHKYPNGFYDFSGGQNDTDNPTDLKNNELLICNNWKIHKDGKSLIKRYGYDEDSGVGAGNNFGDPVRAISQVKDYLGNRRRVVITDKKIFVETAGGGSWTEIHSQATPIEFPMKPVTYESGRLLITGFDKNLYIFSGYQGGDILDAFQLGVDAPASGPSVAEGAAGRITGEYKYLITFSTSGTTTSTQIFPYESNPSLDSEKIAGDVLTDGGLEIWTTITDLTNWTEYTSGSSTVNREGAVVHGGTYSARLDVDGSNSNVWIYQDVTLVQGKYYCLRVWYKMLGSSTSRIQINNVGSNVYLKDDGTWSASQASISLPYTTTWKQLNLYFKCHRDYTSYRVYLANNSSASANLYFDDVSICPLEALTVSGKKINLTNIPISSDSQVRRRRIYRTKSEGEIFYWLADIADNTTTTYTDNFTDDDIAENAIMSYARGVPPVGDDIEVWDGRVWILVPSEGKVYFTNSGEEAEMYIGNFLQIEARETEEPIAIKAYAGNLYVFKKHKTFRIDKIGDYYYEVVETDLPGCDARSSVVVADGLLIWKSEKDIEIFNGDSILKPKISRKIQNKIASINKSYLNKIVAEHHRMDNEYWLSVPIGSSTEPDEVIVVNLDVGAIYSFSFGDKFTSFFNAVDTTDKHSFQCGSGATTTGYLFRYKEGFYDDDGQSIQATFRIKQVPVSDEKEIWNILRRMFVAYQLYPKEDAILMSIYPNLESSAELSNHKLYGSDITDTKIKEIIRKLNLGIDACIVSVEFYHGTLAAGDVRVLGFDFYFDKKTWKRDIYGT